ncbi:MAG: carbohydrate binding family 9 domain-containing protein [Planctomycetes bacterium]|nr:carbohydrate binding family 9 domain-containing protein [Planctomycetota bacterium]
MNMAGFVASIVVFCLTAPVGAQGKPPRDALDRAVDRVNESWETTPAVEIVRTIEAPVIDGELDEEAWEGAAVVEGFRQVEPDEGGPPSESTRIRLLLDRDFIFLGIECRDRDPDGIIATQMARDASLEGDDRVAFVLDTFHDRRNGYFFEINAAGARGDALIENSGGFNRDWDAIWYGASRIDAAGWQAEIAIPFKSISFDAATETWGFNVDRVIRRRNERVRWSSPRQDLNLYSMADAGIITAIRDIEQGLGLDLKPYVSASYRRDILRDDQELEIDGGLDVFYRITPELTGAVTINTDFAEAEVDARQVNLTRFPLFFPEKRDFFLQDAGIFSFGGIRSNPLPFFSRRIGIGSDGEPVTIHAGVKLTGRVGRLNIGVVDAQIGESPDVDGKNLGVARFSYNLSDQHQVGIIGTGGSARSNDANYLGGADYFFRSTDFLGDKVLTSNLWFQRSFAEAGGDDQLAFGGRLDFPNDELDAGLGFGYVGEDFDPGLGFVSRRNIREFFGDARYRFRPAGSPIIRRIDVGINGYLVTDDELDMDSADLGFRLLDVASHAGDSLSLQYAVNAERLLLPFEIMRGVVIPAGHYRFDRIGADLSTSTARPVSGSVGVEWGDFFDGQRLDLMATLSWRPSRHLTLGAEYEQNDIDLRGGDFVTRIARARVNVYFTPLISWTTLVQYDNVSDLAGINSRLRWIFEPGRELFFVVNQGFLLADHDFRSSSTEITAKLGWTFRF